MKANWWYSDKFGQVGPFTLEQLRDALLTLEESHLRNIRVWREGFSEWKSPEVLDDFRDPSGFLLEKSRTRELVDQVKDVIATTGKSYWRRLHREFFRNRQFVQRSRMGDKIDRRRAQQIQKKLRPTPTIAGKVFASSIVFIFGLFAMLVVVGLFMPERGMTQLESPKDWRARRSDICAMTGLRGLSIDDERALRNACFGP